MITPITGQDHARRDRLISLLVILIIGAGFLLRVYRLNWDGIFYPHPDERAIVQHIEPLAFPFPPDLKLLQDPQRSPLNPRWFNYGSLPLYLTKALGTVGATVWKNWVTYDGLRYPGRLLSATLDTLTIFLVFLIARRVYDERVALMASFFTAFSVLHIQLSHFLTVDVALTFFITLAVYFAILLVQTGQFRMGALSGAAMGLAMATKFSVAPLLLTVVVAWFLWLWRERSHSGRPTGDTLGKALLGTTIALLSAGLFFFLGQPYAILDWTRFTQNIDEQSRMVRGIADYPYTRQYLNTIPYLYQVWQSSIAGMGLPLGLVAHGGFLWITLRELVKRQAEELVILSWVIPYFIINGAFQVKFLRYNLPLFPFFFIMGAALLVYLWDKAATIPHLSLPRPTIPVPVAKAQEPKDDAGGEPPRPRQAPSTRARRRKTSEAQPEEPPRHPPSPTPEEGPGEGKGTGTVRRRSTPRAAEVSAEDHPTLSPRRTRPAGPPGEEAGGQAKPRRRRATTTAWEVAESAGAIPVRPPRRTRRVARPPIAEGITPVSSQEAQALPTGRVWPATQAQVIVGAITAVVVGFTLFYALAFTTIYTQPHPWKQISEWIYRNIPPGSTLALEHWEESVPINMSVDGRPRSFGEYRVVDMANYEDDNAQKLQKTIDNILRADYIILASNRLYGTIPRLPERYPIMRRYYELLLGEQLGFKLVSFVAVYPSFLGVTFVDDTFSDAGLPTPELLRTYRPSPITINVGKVDESFTVYDHPKPLVFQKVTKLSRDQLTALFADALKQAQERPWRANRPTVAPRPLQQKSLLLSDSERAIQEAGGTYRDLYPEDSLPNHLPGLTWWLLAEIIGLVAFPLTFVLLRPLRDHGYGLSKTLGILLVTYLPWLTASLKIIPFGRLSLVASLVLVAGASLVILQRQREEIEGFIRRRGTTIVVTEAVFTAAYVFFVIIRILNPDLWQPWNGGEKPMEFAFLNAIAKSTIFPPYDPTYAGGYINYYYYGHYMMAALMRLTGVTPSVSFNLIIPLLFALTVSGAFSLVSHLSGVFLQRYGANVNVKDTSEDWRPMVYGLVGALLVAVSGNLATVAEVLRGPWSRGWQTFHSSIPGLEMVVRTVTGFIASLRSGGRLLEPFNYWTPSRVIPDTINEFPFWSFLFADLHPHLIAIPFTLLALGLALVIVIQPDHSPLPRGEALARFVMSGLTVGAFGAINSWDLPTYLGVMVVAIGLGEWLARGRIQVIGFAVRVGLVVLLAFGFFLPFYISYQAFASGIGLVQKRDDVGYYLAIFGFFIFLLITYLIIDLRDQRRSVMTRLLRLTVTGLDRWPRLQSLWRSLVHSGEGLSTLLTGLGVFGLVLVLCAVTGQMIFVFLFPLFALCLGLMATGDPQPERIFVLLLIGTGLLISIGVEIFFLRDWLQGGSAYRMNTLFKFFIQVWIFFAVASGAVLPAILQRMPRPTLRRNGALLWWSAFAVLSFSVALFPLLGIPARVNDRFPNARPPVGTLDGMAFMTVGVYTYDWQGRNYRVELNYDYDAIRWLQQNVDGSPVIAEAVLPYYREFGARVSSMTGLPALLASQHAQEQRYGDTQVGPREDDVRFIYNETSMERVMPKLRQHRVRYIYVGQLERNLYTPQGLAKFDQAVGIYLDLVYENPKVKIYRVRDDGRG